MELPTTNNASTSNEETNQLNINQSNGNQNHFQPDPNNNNGNHVHINPYVMNPFMNNMNMNQMLQNMNYGNLLPNNGQFQGFIPQIGMMHGNMMQPVQGFLMPMGNQIPHQIPQQTPQIPQQISLPHDTPNPLFNNLNIQNPMMNMFPLGGNGLSMFGNLGQLAPPTPNISISPNLIPTTNPNILNSMGPPQSVEMEEVIKKNKSGQGRRNSIPFSFVSNSGTSNPLPFSSGSNTAGASNSWLEMARARHTHSLENSMSFGVSASCGRRSAMEDEYLVVPYQAPGNQSDTSIPIIASTTQPKVETFGDMPLPSSLNNRKRRPSVTTISYTPNTEDSSKKLKTSENASSSTSTTTTPPSTPTTTSTPTSTPTAISQPVASSPKPTAEKKKPSYAFFAVYDGHGGSGCAEYVRMNLHSNIVNNESFNTDVEKSIIEGFAKTEKDFADEKGHPGCGTTACVALIYENILYVANVGDSGAIVCRNGKAVDLTNPHTMKSESEKKRIEALGGVSIDDRLAHPIWNPKLINIGVTRALGDQYFKDETYTLGKQSGLIATPEITKFPLTNEDRFILLATDGFWEQISSQVAVDFVLKEKGINAKVMCKKLTDLVAKKSNHLEDNTTVLLVKLKEDEEKLPVVNHIAKSLADLNKITSLKEIPTSLVNGLTNPTTTTPTKDSSIDINNNNHKGNGNSSSPSSQSTMSTSPSSPSTTSSTSPSSSSTPTPSTSTESTTTPITESSPTASTAATNEHLNSLMLPKLSESESKTENDHNSKLTRSGSNLTSIDKDNETGAPLTSSNSNLADSLKIQV